MIGYTFRTSSNTEISITNRFDLVNPPSTSNSIILNPEIVQGVEHILGLAGSARQTHTEVFPDNTVKLAISEKKTVTHSYSWASVALPDLICSMILYHEQSFLQKTYSAGINRSRSFSVFPISVSISLAMLDKASTF